MAVHGRFHSGIVFSTEPAHHAVMAEGLVADLAESRGECAFLVATGYIHHKFAAAGGAALERFQPFSVFPPVVLAELGPVWDS